MAQLILALIAIALVFYAVMFVLSILVPVAIVAAYGGWVFGFGRLLVRQVSRVYQLTLASGAALAGVALLALLLTSAWERATGHVFVPFSLLLEPVPLLASSLTFPVWLGLSLPLASSLLGAWGAFKRTPPWVTRSFTHLTREQALRARQRCHLNCQKLERVLQRFDTRFREALRQHHTLGTLADQLVEQDPQTLGVRRDVCVNRLRGLDERQLARLDRSAPPTTHGNALEAVLVRHVRLKRRFEAPFGQHARLKRHLQEKQQMRLSLDSRLTQLQRQSQQGTTAGRLRLDLRR